MKNTLSYLIFAITASASSVAFSAPALDDPCASIVCEEGEICEVVQNDCAACPPAEPGKEPPVCEACINEGVAVCITAPAPPCESDSDCSGEDVCVTYTFGSCSGSAGTLPSCDPNDPDCIEGDPAPEPDPEMCVEETESICVPRYAAPCASASDCGPGFTCETPEICTCSTGQPICNSEDPNCSDLPGDEDCSCKPSGRDAYCQIIPVECTSDRDCENGFSCVSEPERPLDNCLGDCTSDPLPSLSHCLPGDYSEWVSQGGGRKVGERRPETAERKGFFSGGSNQGNASGEKDEPGCQVSQSPTGLAGFSFLLLGLMFGTRRKRK